MTTPQAPSKFPKLSILHTESSIGWGGQEIRILTEAAGMIARGHAVTLVTPPEAEIFDAARRMGIPTVAMPIAKKSFSALFQLRSWLARNADEFGLVNTHSSTDSWLVALANATLPNPLPLVRTRHVSTAINNSWATQWLYKRATQHIVTTGEALRQQLHRDNGYALENMTSIRTGISRDRFQPLDRAAMRTKLGVAHTPTLGILATLRDWKGHDYLFDAFKQLRASATDGTSTLADWQILVVGDGPQRQRLEARVRDEGLSGKVQFVGNVDNVPEWLACMDVFALPSYGDEGVPQGIMQAMACGLPVVSTTVGAIGEAVQHEQTGFLVPPRDTAALAEKLGLLMTNASLRARMGRAGQAYAREHFGIDVMLDRMTAVFNLHRRDAMHPVPGH